MYFTYSLAQNVDYPEDLRIQQVRYALCDWVDKQGRCHVRVWGREKFERCLVFAGTDIPGCPQTYGTNTEQGRPQKYDIAFVGFVSTSHDERVLTAYTTQHGDWLLS